MNCFWMSLGSFTASYFQMEHLNSGDLEFDFRYDFSGFFKSYPFFNVSALAETVGINASLLRKYKNGLAFPSRQQKEKIEKGIHALSEQF